MVKLCLLVHPLYLQSVPQEPKKLSSEVGPPQLMEGKVIEKLTRLTLKIINSYNKDRGAHL